MTVATTVRAYAAQAADTPLAPFTIERRELRPDDIAIDITHCGVCHSDIHQARNEWHDSLYPMVPGHEIVGIVAAFGDAVTGWQPGDRAGVGVFVDSCRSCDACLAGLEQYCERGMSPTYNGREQDGVTPTYGGYSERIVVDRRYVLRVPDGMDSAGAAPLFCAGITTYSPIRHFGVSNGERAAVVGLGGLGHLAVKFLAAMGAEVTVLSRSPGKIDTARALGAGDVVITTDAAALEAHRRRFDFIIDTIAAAHPYEPYLRMLRRDGIMVQVGLPDPAPLNPMLLVNWRRRIAGSQIGGIGETQEMLEFCAAHGITADVELISIDAVNEAFERTIRSDVRYRFVIDMASLRREDTA
ncbi:MAG: NAD(P)-dependent alcohol dehydrogenase [Candidatus Dormibacteraeota bacterium]|nr:NAD(P)-dependent alcohol dehydrogenase [Candidatus Dormibacteraeota bacterium]